MSGWYGVRTESVEVVDLYINCVKPEDECIHSLDNFRSDTVLLRGVMKWPE